LSAAEAAEFLRRQSAASLSRAERAAALNQLAHQMLRQQQAAALAELRQLRSDWRAVGTGAGLDPVLAMELEAAESVTEQALLADALKFIADGRFADAETKLDSLGAARYLSVSVVEKLTVLRAELRRTIPFVRMGAELQFPNPSFKGVWQPIAAVPRKELPVALVRAGDVWHGLELAGALFRTDSGAERATVENLNFQLKGIATIVGPELAAKLRVELAARLFLADRANDAAQLLEEDVDAVHAAAVLADLRAIVLGRGEVSTPQIAALVPPEGSGPPAPSATILPSDQLAKWKPPTRKSGETTIGVALVDAKARFKTVTHALIVSHTTKVKESADCVRAVLAAEAALLGPFLDKVEAARGKPFASPVERQLAVVAGTRGLTVAETIGVLAAEADRPAVAARLLATVPAFSDPGHFAVAVELAGRTPAAFAKLPDAEFKLPGVRDRARVRDAVAAVTDSHAAKVAAGLPVDPLDRAALEAGITKRLGLAENVLQPAECTQALLDVCHDWFDAQARLVSAAQELNEIVANVEAGKYGEMDDELTELLSTAKLRRLSVQIERKRREAGVTANCQLLGAYGSAAKPAADWLGAQVRDGKPWSAAALDALEKIGGK
jgi:hypothetical protein